MHKRLLLVAIAALLCGVFFCMPASAHPQLPEGFRWGNVYEDAEQTYAGGYSGLAKGDDGNYYYYVDGAVQTDFTGLVPNAVGNWYIVNGMARLNYDGMITFEGTKYLIKSGRVNTAFSGIIKREGVYYYFSEGVNDLRFEGLVSCNGMKAYVQDGEVNFNKSGIVRDDGTLLYVKYGIWRDTYQGLARTDAGDWLFMKNGAFDETYTGAAKLNTSWAYVSRGMVDFKYNGTVIVNDATYAVRYGVVIPTDVSKPQIILQPVSASAHLGEEATLTVAATGTGLRYVWCVKDRTSEHFSRTNCTDTTYHLEMNLETHDRQVYCEVTDAYGNLAFSDIVTLSVGANQDAKPLKIQVFGDSATSETYNDFHTWVSNLQAVLPQYRLTVVNSAVGGNTLIQWKTPVAVGDGTFRILNKGVAWQVAFDEPQTGAPETTGFDQYAPLDPDADLVIVWAGSNEWGGGENIDIIGDRSELTVGEVEAAFTEIKGSYLSPFEDGFKLYSFPVIDFSADYYPVVAGETYRIYGKGVMFHRTMPLGMFTTAPQVMAGYTTGTPIVADDGSVNLNESPTAATDFNFEFTAPQNGYIVIAKNSNYPALVVNHMRRPDTGCIYGAVRFTVEAIREKCPNARILFLTPMQRYDIRVPARPVDPVTGNELNPAGIQLLQVVDAIEDACDYYGIAYLDMYRDSGFNRENFQPGGEYTLDGLHPNGAADILIAQLIGEKIEAVLGD